MDVVTLGAALNGSKKYTDQVAQSLMGGVRYRGSVSYYDDLPANPAEGDSYTVKYAGSSGSVEDGTEYTWGYDTDTSDYAWISFSKNAYSKAETDVLLGGKQNTIDSTHKLSSDLVDDSSSANKFATAAQLSQIETNKNNILYNQNAGYLQKNLSPWTGGTTSTDGSFVGGVQALSLSAGTYTISFLTTATTGRCSINFLDNSASVGEVTFANTTGRISDNITISSAATRFRFYTQKACTVSEFQITKSGADTSYTPYAMSNAELTEKTVGMTEGGSNYITVGGIRVYVSATAPTGARTGDLWIGG